MKRQIILLCILMLLTGTAYAEFDFSPYALQGHNAMNVPILLDEHTAVAVTYATNDGDAPRYLTWWKDHQMVREVQLRDRMNNLQPQLGADGVITWVYVADLEEPVDPYAWPRLSQLRAFVLNDDNTANDTQWTDKLVNQTAHGQDGCIMYDEWIDGMMYVTIRNAKGETLLHKPLNFRKFSQMAYPNRYVYNNDGSCWLTVNDSGTAWLYLIKPPYQVGQICSVKGYPGLSSDGKGGVFFSQSVGSGTYKPVKVTHYGHSSAKLGEVTISGSNVLISFCIQPQEDGNLMLCGKAVANSHQVYLAWRVLCDSELRPIGEFDVREFNYHGDYGFDFAFSPNGTWYLFSNGISKDAPSVLVPFDVLPMANNPGLTIR